MARLLLVSWLTLAGLPLAASRARAADPPNVIVVITDDQGYGDLGCHGNPVLKTPNLDRLWAESIRLTDFHVSPMCTPTRGQLMTGLDGLRNGAMNVSSGRTLLRRGTATMADLFAAGGYQCGQFGKWHLGDNYPYRPHDRGFHEAIYYPSSHIGSAPDFWNNDYFDDTYQHRDRREAFKGYTTDVFFREAIGWMRTQSADGKPFFCYLATAAAHGPLFVPQRYREAYQGQNPNVASYFGMVANIDENIGRLEEFLQQSGLRDNTILIFMTDNGGTAGVPLYNAGMRGRKIELYEGGHRVPCFVRWPKGQLRPPADVAELTQVQDILPTLLDLCGLPQPSGVRFDGSSLAPLLRGELDQLPDRMLVVQFSRMNAPRPQKSDACVLWKRWRLVGGKELYDVAADLSQAQNVAAEHPQVVERMQAHYERWWAGVEPQVNQFSRVVIGSDAENPALLSACEWADVFLDQSRQVRRGERKNGVWHLEIERDGRYEFTLRRWPKEAEAPISAGLPQYEAADGVMPPGVDLPIAKARIRLGSLDESRGVGPTDAEVQFSALLKAGPVELQTWFYDADGREICGAYYVYVQREKAARGAAP
jgi:arylsulfatase